jgi:hypothetical protein
MSGKKLSTRWTVLLALLSISLLFNIVNVTGAPLRGVGPVPAGRGSSRLARRPSNRAAFYPSTSAMTSPRFSTMSTGSSASSKRR